MEANQIVSNIGPCAGCKFLRRKCQPDCIFAPHFPSDQIQKFQVMHQVFGASNISKMLQDIHPSNREDAVKSLSYEAEMRQLNPISGCMGVVTHLHNQLNKLRADLLLAKVELVKCQNLGFANHNLLSIATTPTPANVNTYNCLNQQLYSSLQQQQQNAGNNFMGMCSDGNVVGQDNFLKKIKKPIQSFDGANNYHAQNVVGMNEMIDDQVEMIQCPMNADHGSIINPNMSQSSHIFNSYDMLSHI